MITFAQHNLLRDPPFSHLDLISCRNVLIYLDKEAQHEVLGLFHFALRRDGLLLLGSSETAHRQDDLFTTVDDSHRCYRRSEIPSPPLLMTRRGMGFRSMGPFSPVPALRRSGAGAAHAPSPVIAEASPSGSAPAFVMVDDDYRPCYHYGSIATFLPHAEPFANESVLEHCDPTLSGMLNAALQKCAAESAPTSIHYVTHPRVSAVDARSATLLPVIEVTVQPVHGEGRASLFMISFRERLGPQEEPLRDAVDRGEVEALHALGMLQEELKSTREELSSSIEELETSNEELKASNEEVRSMYEELQSANEELETSREELMSVNEELGAVNKRLHENVEELADTSDVLSNLLSSTDLPTLFLDRQLCIQRFTPAAGRLMRLIPGDVGRPLEDLNDHLGGDRLLGDARRVLTFLIPIEGEVQTADGSAFMLRTHPYRTADDRIEGVVITLTNIDLLKRAEDELRDSEQRLRTIFDNAAVGMAQIGAGGGILTCNQTLCQITGLARHVLTSKPLSEFIEPRHWPPLAQALERLMRTANASETLELPLQREDGRRWLRCTLSSVGGSERREVILIVEDITGRREAEHQLQHRTHQLQRSNEDLSHFAAMASHDLQAPLRIIGGYLDMITQLGDDLSEDQKRKYFARVIDNVHVMRRMITDMLEYARCEMGEVAMESCPLGDAVDSACANLAPLIAEQEAEIIVGNLPTVTAPTRLVVQLFQNLIDNAIKYRRQVRPKITITADRDGDAWRVQVADNGRGIAKQDAPHVFSLFERGDRVQQGGGQHPKISGSGLGLAICRKAIDRLGGRIWFDSQPDQGTTFSFLLPDPTTRMKTVPSASDA